MSELDFSSYCALVKIYIRYSTQLVLILSSREGWYIGERLSLVVRSRVSLLTGFIHKVIATSVCVSVISCLDIGYAVCLLARFCSQS